MVVTQPTKTLDGTNGGEVPVSRDLPNIQMSISGRATGTLTVTGKSNGSDAFEAFLSPLTIDLSAVRTVILEPTSLVSLSFTVSAPGPDFGVTISQWFTQ